MIKLKKKKRSVVSERENECKQIFPRFFVFYNRAQVAELTSDSHNIVVNWTKCT